VNEAPSHAPGYAASDQGVLRRLRREHRRIREAATIAMADDLPPAIQTRVRALLRDLSADDLSMAVLDLAHLYQSVAGLRDTPAVAAPAPTSWPGEPTALIASEDQTALPEACEGPDRHGKCPRAHADGPVACADRWLLSSGWTLKVAPDANVCPLSELGFGPAASSRQRGPNTMEE
jgi:hypothetical protein